MKKIESISYDETLNNFNLSGKIHSSFNRTFNILTESDYFFTVAVNSVFDGPNMLKIKESNFEGMIFERGMMVKQVDEGLVIADKVWIDLSKAEIYQIKPLVFPNKPNTENNNTFLGIEKYLSEQLDTVGFFRKTYQNNLEKEQHDRLLACKNALNTAVKEENKKLLEKEVIQLIGYGNGLTPSGDDFLTGLLLVANSVNYPFVTLRNSLNETVSRNLKRTNDISQHQLLHGIEGIALEPIMTFLRELNQEEIDNIQLENSLNQVISIGSSSGSDMIAGILFGLEVTFQKIIDCEN